MTPDCRVHPIFRSGEHYLVFHGGPVSLRSFERIFLSDDLWLKVARGLVRKEKIGPIMGINDFISQFETINLYLCPSRAYGNRSTQLMDTLKGNLRTTIKYRPRFFGTDKGCDSKGRKFILMESNGRIPIALELIDDYFDLSHGLDIELIPNNKISLKQLKDL